MVLYMIMVIFQLGIMKLLCVIGSLVVDLGKVVDFLVVDVGIQGIFVDEVDMVFVLNEYNLMYLIFINICIDIGINKCMLFCDKIIICYDINIYNMQLINVIFFVICIVV